MSTKEMHAPALAAVDPVTGQASYEWSLKLYEHQGRCFVAWSSNSPFRAQQGQIALYSNSFPSTPTDRIVASVWDNDPNPWDTGKIWGSGWCAAHLAQASPNGPYVYAVKTGVTK
jgi:hypothetical protein